MRSFLRYWLPVLLWALFISWMSTDAGSTRHTSRFIRPFLHWIYPQIRDDTVAQVQFFVRKTAHVTEYGFLAVLLWRARRRAFWGDPRPWRPSEATFAVIVAMLFAVIDEWHQTFVPGREGRAADVLIDGAGAVAAMLAVRWVHQRWQQRLEAEIQEEEQEPSSAA
ncbi:MAG TPA: VanZ family protein [Verrucomicrobiae bacterium]|nr:VanZ family protein [Verrucomicrobiae bacterium]